jgi:hypothetical protein
MFPQAGLNHEIIGRFDAVVMSQADNLMIFGLQNAIVAT